MVLESCAHSLYSNNQGHNSEYPRIRRVFFEIWSEVDGLSRREEEFFWFHLEPYSSWTIKNWYLHLGVNGHPWMFFFTTTEDRRVVPWMRVGRRSKCNPLVWGGGRWQHDLRGTISYLIQRGTEGPENQVSPDIAGSWTLYDVHTHRKTWEKTTKNKQRMRTPLPSPGRQTTLGNNTQQL